MIRCPWCELEALSDDLLAHVVQTHAIQASDSDEAAITTAAAIGAALWAVIHRVCARFGRRLEANEAWQVSLTGPTSQGRIYVAWTGEDYERRLVANGIRASRH